MLQITKPKPVKRKQEEEEGYREGTLFFNYDDDEENVELDSGAPSSFMLKMQEEMKKPPTPLPVVSSWEWGRLLLHQSCICS